MTAPATLSLLDWSPPVTREDAPEQPANLARVGGRIGPHVLEFCRIIRDLSARHGGEPEFRMGGLVGFILARGVQCAPASADRILRQLRAQGFVAYTVVDRAASLYRIDSVSAGAGEGA